MDYKSHNGGPERFHNTDKRIETLIFWLQTELKRKAIWGLKIQCFFLFYFVYTVVRHRGQQVTQDLNVYIWSIHYMHSAVGGEVRILPCLVPSTVVFFLIPLAPSLLLRGGTLFFIYNEKIMSEIFTTTRGGKSFNKTWNKTMAEVALRTRMLWKTKSNVWRQSGSSLTMED